MINIKKSGFNNKVTKERDTVMLLLLRQLNRDAAISEHLKRFGNRRQPRRGAENNDQFTENGPRKTKYWLTNKKKCNSYKRKLVKSLPTYRGITVRSEVLASFSWPAVLNLAKLNGAEFTVSAISQP